MNKKANTYHKQAEIDKYAKTDDRQPAIPTTSFKQIKEAYDELMRDLMMESQEAY